MFLFFTWRCSSQSSIRRCAELTVVQDRHGVREVLERWQGNAVGRARTLSLNPNKRFQKTRCANLQRAQMSPRQSSLVACFWTLRSADGGSQSRDKKHDFREHLPLREMRVCQLFLEEPALKGQVLVWTVAEARLSQSSDLNFRWFRDPKEGR